MKVNEIPTESLFVIAEALDFIYMKLPVGYYHYRTNEIYRMGFSEFITGARILDDDELRELLNFDRNELEIWKNDQRTAARSAGGYDQL